MEERGLLLGVTAQFGHFINAVHWTFGPVLLTLALAFSLVTLFLLARLFLLALIECRSASWHGKSFLVDFHSLSALIRVAAWFDLPAWLARLARMTLIVVAASAAGASTARALPAAATATKTLATAWAIGLRLSLVDLERATAKFGSVQGRNGLFGFAGVGHFDEGESTRPSGFTVRDHADSFDGSVGLEQIA
jgi:hypothetical protein